MTEVEIVFVFFLFGEKRLCGKFFLWLGSESICVLNLNWRGKEKLEEHVKLSDDF
jgi:hypothetical protein